ncbi:MAG: hypothetical protein IT320_07930 [Anaerolineae bacterium]|nr:hypothetical protein [Anaerolineae bacterium]
MKLTKNDYTFNNTKLCQIMPKQIELNRLLINLYMLLKYDGRRPVARTGRVQVDLEWIVDQLVSNHSSTLEGFGNYRDVVADWIYSDLLDIANRGKPDQEKVAAPLPLHLNAYKLRNPKQANDYRGAEHIYSMLEAGDRTIISRLADFLGQGMEADKETYDGETALDLDTLTIVRMVDNENLRERPSSRGEAPDPPLCIGNSRLFCDDLRRLLAYENVVPRSVLIDYIRTAVGFHLGLYLIRMFHQVSGWVAKKTANHDCLNCPVQPIHASTPYQTCPFAFQNRSRDEFYMPEIIVDMGEDYTSHMAKLARENCGRHFAVISQYIRSVFTINQVFRFSQSQTGRRQLKFQPESVAEVLNILKDPPSGLDYFFDERITNIAPIEDDDEEKTEILSVRDMETLTPLEKFVELVSLERTKYYRKYLTQQLDSLLMKNTDTGLMRQGKGAGNQRRWHIGSRLLEMFVQIAVLDTRATEHGQELYSRPILIDEFVAWLKERYGIVVVPDSATATIRDYEAFNSNYGNLKNRLREIGFYMDLSDAYNAQKIRPRYEIRSGDRE